MSTRRERDSMGEVEVPADRYWGAQTQRALENFAIGGERFPREVIWALGVVKRACAEVNRDLGELDAGIAEVIARAAEEVVAGELDEHFPLAVWQTGSGTQTNMNANEVIANRANELLGGPLGTRDPVHPNDHVNKGQSSNDVFPTVMHVAAVERIQTRLEPALARLQGRLEDKAKAFAGVVKVGRTHLQDATPVTLGQVFAGHAAQLDHGRRALRDAAWGLHQLAQGGTAVGTGLNAHPELAARAAGRIAELTGMPFVTAPNKLAALAGHDAIVIASGALKTLATALMKIANDVRWLASGPRCGIGEITIPANEPGSSIMPGKVNPTQAEALTMVCCQVLGNDVAIGVAGASGNFELNAYKPVMIFNLLNSIRLLADASESFDERCVAGIEPMRQRIRENIDKSLMLVTALTPAIGYDRAAEVAQKAHAENRTLREVVLELGLMDGETFDATVRPADMVGRSR